MTFSDFGLTEYLIRKLIHGILILFAAILIGSYISYLLGSEYFLLSENLGNENFLVRDIVDGVLLFINMLFVFTASLALKFKRIFIIDLIYIVLAIGMSFIGLNGLLISAVLPFIIIVISLVIHYKDIKSILICIIKFIIFTIVFGIYQFLSSKVKLDFFQFQEYSDQFSLDTIIKYSIDLIVVGTALSLWIKRWWIKYVQKANTRLGRASFKFPIHSENFDVGESKEDRRFEELLIELKTEPMMVRIRTWAIFSAMWIFQAFVILGAAMIGNVLVELLIILPSFWIFRAILKRSWHSQKVIFCAIISAAIFYLGATLALPLAISIFIPIVIGLLIAIALYEVSYLPDKLNILNKVPR